ncbi:MAG TPA: benzoylformate decarboxylase, partial [Thermomicrobiales bacterium]|nr:benzoylformate decarboxylase [Thermomicrobiales bacterium]
MTTVREATWDLLRSLGMTTIFGNPGSTEEPFLQDFPDDLRYILGLQEAAVIGMADGFAQASDNAAFVNLHTAPGVGHAMGNIVTAWHNQTPLVVTAGQQTRAMLAMEPWLVNREAVDLPKPYVKWSNEPPRPQDVPAAIERAYHIAMQPPRGPVFVSIPMDDWDAPATPRPCRAVSRRAAPDPAALDRIADRLRASRAPAIVAGPGIDRAGGWEAAVALAERLEAPVWSAPAPERAGFPQMHRLFQGFLPLAIGPIADALAPHDLVLVFGAPIFRYYPYIPGPILAAGTRLVLITDHPDEAARAPVGDAAIGDVALAIAGLLARLEELPPREQTTLQRPVPAVAPATESMSAAYV